MKNKHLRQFIICALFCAAIICMPKLNAQAHTDTQDCAVTVLANNNASGAVFCTKNGQTFEHYTYCAATDTVTITALRVNKGYFLLHFIDNGVIINNHSEQYTFNVGGKNHRVVAVFEETEKKRGHHYDTDNNISSITRNTNACEYVKEDKIIGMTLNTNLTTIDAGTIYAAQVVSGENYSSAYDIQLTYANDGKKVDMLKAPVRVTLSLPRSEVKAGRVFHVICGNGQAPVLLPDLDQSDLTVTFSLQQSAVYVLTYSDTMPAAPIPAQPTPGVLIPLPQ